MNIEEITSIIKSRSFKRGHAFFISVPHRTSLKNVILEIDKAVKPICKVKKIRLALRQLPKNHPTAAICFGQDCKGIGVWKL